ncbi:MAG TPA: PAS domain-containing protein [Candidatus Acidoferrales bacterium]|nr:PAS domain-containing protein [Candidatus Acidoferrales bacterium]
MSSPPKPAAAIFGLPPNPAATITRQLLWRALAVMFFSFVAADVPVDAFRLRSVLLDASIASFLAVLIALPLLFAAVVLPAVRLITREAAAATEKRVEAILDAVSDGAILSNLEGVIQFANLAVHRLLGHPPGSMKGRRARDLAPLEYSQIRAADVAAFLAGEPCTLLNRGPREGVALRSSGEVFPVELTWNSLPQLEPAGKPQFIAILREITARKRREAALRESEALFRTLADTAPALIWMADDSGYLNYLNKGWLDFRGRTLDQELNLGWIEGLHPEDYQRCLDTFDQAFKARKPYEMEYRMRRHDGEFRWLLDRGVPRWSDDGSLAGFIGFCMDVTVRKQAEDALRASEQRFRELLEGLPVAVRIVQDDKLVFANLADAHLHGFSLPEQEIGLDPSKQIAPDEVARLSDLHRRRTAGEAVPRRLEVRRRRRDGSEVLTEIEAERTFFDGRPASLVVIRDLTDRKRVEVYEKLLPVCCVCGKIRDDNALNTDAAWQRLDQYLSRHSDAEFSHTFCPECFLEYRQKNLSSR